jgi:hypothetical protein
MATWSKGIDRPRLHVAGALGSQRGQDLFSFRPERVLFRPGGVNLRASLCGVRKYASAQPLDFLASTKNASFSNWKLPVFHPEFPDGH